MFQNSCVHFSPIKDFRIKIQTNFSLTLTISQEPNILAKIISSKHDIDISILSDIMLISNIGNIDIDIDIDFTTYLWGGEAPHK